MRNESFERPPDAALDPALEALLREGLTAPPADFTARVLAALPAPQAEGPPPVAPAGRRRPAARGLAWLTAAGAGLFGLVQLLSFAFAVWSATTAG